MEETLMSFNTARLLKEKGFDIPVYYHYSENCINDIIILCEPDDPQLGQGWILTDYNDKTFLFNKYSAPTLSLAQKWLRELHNIEVEVYRCATFTTGENYGVEILDWRSGYEDSIYNTYEKTYEEALEAGIVESLKLIK